MSVNKNNNGVLQKIAGGTLYADAPIGCIQAFGGTTAPVGWMLCQGQALSRTTYKALFDVIGTSFGTGDGSTTFNIPDLRGEFLRGAGTNSHSGEGNGGTVGEHQGATRITTPYVEGSAGGSGNLQAGAISTDGSGSYSIKNQDALSTDNSSKWTKISGLTITAGGSWRTFLPRPTNTSVNYIIKVVQTSLPIDMLEHYSTEETVIGTWIDGKPLYQKTYTGIFNDGTSVNTGLSNAKIRHINSFTTFSNGYSSPFPYCTTSGIIASLRITDINNFLFNLASGWSNNTYEITVRYTKTTD